MTEVLAIEIPSIQLEAENIITKISLWDSNKTEINEDLTEIDYDGELTIRCDFQLDLVSIQSTYNSTTSAALYFTFDVPSQISLSSEEVELTYSDKDIEISLGTCYISGNSQKV
ncbi:MAG: hypothetical protein J6F30_00730 [Cellulosilyticum sp.]|nr:hypothetical protein [Cellulosilyticum sp.]